MPTRSRRGSAGAALLAACLLLVPARPRADVPLERTGRVETLRAEPSPHWVWVTDLLLERAALLDLDEGGGLLGIVSAGYSAPQAVFSARRRELYVPETYYSRKTRGERTDVVSIYDVRSLAPVAEVVLPPKRAINTLPSANATLSDDGRFLAVFNMTPATSLSIVDVQERLFVGEIQTPGCSLVYAAGPRRFASICMDGSLMVVSLNAAGREAGKIRTEPFFDPATDPVTEKAVRLGDRWLFVSFEGKVHSVDVSGAELAFGEVWSLTNAEDASASWRIGGTQHLAIHEASGRLYCLMHRGGRDTHKQAGTEVWVYDVASRARLQRIPLRNPGFTVLGESLEFGGSWVWPFNRLYDGLLGVVPWEGIDSIQVTRDAEPLLATASLRGGSVGVYDALSGAFRRRVLSGNFTSHALYAPFGGAEGPP